MKNIVLMLVAGLLLVSCGDKKGGVEPDFSSAEVVYPADSIAINEILKPWDWKRVGEDKIVLFSEDTDMVAYTYTFPDFKYLYKWGTVGEGPEDFSSNPDALNPSRDVDDTLRIYERGKMRNYIITDTAAVSAGTATENIGNYLPLESVGPVRVGEVRYHVIPRMHISFSGEEKQGRILRIYDDVKNEVADSMYLDVVSVVKQHSGGMQGSMYNIPSVMVTGDTLVLVYPQLHRVQAFRISANGHLNELYAVGDTRKNEEIKNLNWDNMPLIKEMGTGAAVMGEEMYVFYFIGSKEAIDDYDFENIKVYAVVYDMQGRVKRVKAFDRTLTNFMCYNGKVYAYNFEEDFENVYIYTL